MLSNDQQISSCSVTIMTSRCCIRTALPIHGELKASGLTRFHLALAVPPPSSPMEGGLGDQAVTGDGVAVFRLVCWKKTLRSLLATARPGTLSACCLTAA